MPTSQHHDRQSPATPTSATPQAKTDAFVDDLILVFLDTKENCERAPAAVPLAIHTVAQPMSPDEPVPREPFFAMEKILGEGALAEVQQVVGWTLDLRRLLILLPANKFRSWSKDVTSLSKSR
jgi:hypothetical protein